jgi:UDP-galactose transporter B1
MAWLGYLMVAFAVLSDAFFLDNQAYCKSKYKPTSNHMLTSANLFTFAICLGHSFLQGTLYDEIRFCIEHPTVNIEIILLSLLQSFGQVAIYFIITNFKQHMFPLVSMTRKIMTILLSIFIYGHAVNVTQWLCICLVFGSLSYELFEEVVLLNKAEQNKIKDKQQ